MGDTKEPMSRTVQPAVTTPRARLAGWRRAACSANAALLRAVWLLLRQPSALWFAISTPFKFWRQRRAHPLGSPLLALSPGVWRVPARALDAAAEAHDPVIVLQFTGTGESVHAAYENTRALFDAQPALASSTHYVFEAPHEKGAYYGPEAFGASLWQRVEPIVRHYPGPFVLVGVSRGGLVALDHGARIAEEQGKVASVLALSAPVAAPPRIPLVIAGISGFVESLEGLVESLPQVAARVRRDVERVVSFFYLALIALILRFHRVYSLESLQRHALDVRDHGVLNTTLRCAREFRLLVRTSERKLQLHNQLVQRALAQHQRRFFACLVWGAEDGWIDAQTCLRRFTDAKAGAGPAPCWAADGQKASASDNVAVLHGQGHLLAADDAALGCELAPFFARVAREACRLGGSDDPDAEAARRVQNELHLAGEATREHE